MKKVFIAVSLFATSISMFAQSGSPWSSTCVQIPSTTTPYKYTQNVTLVPCTTNTLVTNQRIGIGTSSPQASIDIRNKNSNSNLIMQSHLNYMNGDIYSTIRFDTSPISQSGGGPVSNFSIYTTSTSNIKDPINTWIEALSIRSTGINFKIPIVTKVINSTGSISSAGIIHGGSLLANNDITTQNGKFSSKVLDDWQYGYLATARGQNARAFALVSNTGAELVTIWGNGMVAAKTIKTTELRVHSSAVNNTSWWPDYVFKPNYQLETLSEVEKFTKNNYHLPGVPSEKEIIENGIDVAEMNAVLLRKIEELYLHSINQQKEIEKIKSELSAFTNSK